VSDTDVEVAIDCFCGDAHFACSGELDGVPDQVEQHLGQALLVADADRKRLCHFCLERDFLRLRERLGRHPYCLDDALDRVFGHVQAELPRCDLSDVENGVDEAQQVLAVGADASEHVEQFLAEWLIEMTPTAEPSDYGPGINELQH
jgi:hypothetical protein